MVSRALLQASRDECACERQHGEPKDECQDRLGPRGQRVAVICRLEQCAEFFAIHGDISCHAGRSKNAAARASTMLYLAHRCSMRPGKRIAHHTISRRRIFQGEESDETSSSCDARKRRRRAGARVTRVVCAADRPGLRRREHQPLVRRTLRRTDGRRHLASRPSSREGRVPQGREAAAASSSRNASRTTCCSMDFRSRWIRPTAPS